MTRLLSLSPDRHRYESLARYEATSLPGVHYTVRRMSLGRRIELAEQVRELAGRLEFHQAGTSTQDRIAAGAAAAEIDAAYIRWGLVGVENLSIDGRPANASAVIDGAPESFVREIVECIQRECGITDDERKN